MNMCWFCNNAESVEGSGIEIEMKKFSGSRTDYHDSLGSHTTTTTYGVQKIVVPRCNDCKDKHLKVNRYYLECIEKYQFNKLMVLSIIFCILIVFSFVFSILLYLGILGGLALIVMPFFRNYFRKTGEKQFLGHSKPSGSYKSYQAYADLKRDGWKQSSISERVSTEL